MYKGKHLPRAAQTGLVSPGGDAKIAWHWNPKGRQGIAGAEKRGEDRDGGSGRGGAVRAAEEARGSRSWRRAKPEGGSSGGRDPGL